MIYGSWNIRCDRQKFSSFLGNFLPFQPLDNLENQNFNIEKKKKKTPGDIIILPMLTMNDSQMMYGSWDMECNKQNFLSFRTAFYPFTPLTTWKIKILKKWKKIPGDIIILHMCTINDHHMMYGSWNIETNRFFVILDQLFPFYPLTTQKIKILKKWKKLLEILALHTCVP